MRLSFRQSFLLSPSFLARWRPRMPPQRFQLQRASPAALDEAFVSSQTSHVLTRLLPVQKSRLKMFPPLHVLYGLVSLTTSNGLEPGLMIPNNLNSSPCNLAESYETGETNPEAYAALNVYMYLYLFLDPWRLRGAKTGRRTDLSI